MPDEIIVTLETPEVDVNIDDKISIIPPYNHNELHNLDYEHSGHTGFASTEHLNLLVPKRLSVLPTLDDMANNDTAMLYVDNNGNDSKISISKLRKRMIKQGDSIPTDLQAGEYLFLEIKED